MIVNKGKQASQWLAEVEKDQNLETLSELLKVEYDTLRRLFLSAMLSPSLDYGHLNPATNRPVLGMQSPETSYAYTTASVAALTLTCAANRRYRVYFAGAVNITQVSQVALTGGFGTITTNVPMVQSISDSQSQYNGVIGTRVQDMAAGASVSGELKEVWLEAGDSITVTLATYAAGNNTEHLILYEEYRTG